MGGSKSKTRVKKRPRLWFTRDKYGSGFYNLYSGEKPSREFDYVDGSWKEEEISFCSHKFERFMPSKYHLPPGGGPVEFKP